MDKCEPEAHLHVTCLYIGDAGMPLTGRYMAYTTAEWLEEVAATFGIPHNSIIPTCTGAHIVAVAKKAKKHG